MPFGADISEFQTRTPRDFGEDYYHIRVLNENGRLDFRWEQHYANVGSWGLPRGAYGIISPNGPDPNEYARRYVAVLKAFNWELAPTIDIELGNAAANRPYAATVSQRLREAGFPVVIGYYSRDSAYRQFCQDLFERQWIACYGCGFPAGAHEHQFTSNPYDRNYCPDLNLLRAGPGGQDMTPAEHDALIQTRLIVGQLQDHLLSQHANDVRESTLEAAQTAATWGSAIYAKLP